MRELPFPVYHRRHYYYCTHCESELKQQQVDEWIIIILKYRWSFLPAFFIWSELTRFILFSFKIINSRLMFKIGTLLAAGATTVAAYSPEALADQVTQYLTILVVCYMCQLYNHCVNVNIHLLGDKPSWSRRPWFLFQPILGVCESEQHQEHALLDGGEHERPDQWPSCILDQWGKVSPYISMFRQISSFISLYDIGLMFFVWYWSRVVTGSWLQWIIRWVKSHR